ncbi:hypothetical protein N8Z81_04810 [Akkermansiaceae bacterium]|nr:hypothetical protein [Akkermansiaceae bacterium]
MRKFGKRVWDSPLATTWAATSAQLASLMLVLPLVLAKFSAEEVRFWLILNSLLIISMLVEVGFSSVFSRLYAFAMAGRKPHELGIQNWDRPNSDANPDWKTLAQLNQAGQRVFFRLGFLYLIILGGIGTWVVQDVVDGLANPQLGWAAWAVMVVVQPIVFVGKKYGCYLSGTGLIAINQRFAALVSFFSAAAMVTALFMGAGIFTVIVIGQLTALAAFFRGRILALKARPGKYLDSLLGSTVSSEIWGVAWPSAWKSAIGQISLTGTTHLTVLLFSKGVDPVEGAAYLLTLRLVTTVSQIANAPFYSKLPFLGKLRGTGDLDEFRKLAIKGMSLASFVFVI